MQLTRDSQAVVRSDATTYQFAANDTARLGFDFGGATNRGLLVEPSATNLVPHARPTASTWASVSATATDRGTTNFGIFTGVTVASQGQIWNRVATDLTVTNGQNYAVATYLVGGTSGRLRIRLRDTAGGTETRVNGSFGALSGAATTAGAITGLTEMLLADGATRRVSFVFTPNFSGTLNFGVGPDSATVGETVEFLAAQFEEGMSQTSFIDTGATSASRSADLPVLNDWNGNFDVVATFSDGSTQTFPAQSVSPGYWPAGLSGHITAIQLI
ncbi:phage head spike fiber domain-containing protein [Actibacterium mucosum]|uniref:phage head spike fiber domain-containing protein n=1 Tax=Actibacterium mucosum TaxID=1087332 RepID=UPI00126926F7|nr:hypothetical protein [Actibacterium mucosum]